MHNLDEIIIFLLQETIRKKGNKYCLVAGSGRNLGCYKSRSGAIKREKQVNYFKHKKKIKKEDAAGSISGYTRPLEQRKDNE